MRSKIVSLLALSLMTASVAVAQYGRPTFMAGLAGGATLSDFANPDTPSRWGGTAGLFVGRPTYATLTVIEVNWTQKGGKGANNTRLDYVEVPLTFGGVARTRGGEGRARLYGGISVAFPIGCKSDLAQLCDRTKSEWGVPFGLLLGKWSAQERVVGIDVRYTIPLSRAVDLAGFSPYNNSWQFRVFVGRPAGR